MGLEAQEPQAKATVDKVLYLDQVLGMLGMDIHFLQSRELDQRKLTFYQMTLIEKNKIQYDNFL